MKGLIFTIVLLYLTLEFVNPKCFHPQLIGLKLTYTTLLLWILNGEFLISIQIISSILFLFILVVYMMLSKHNMDS